MVEYLDPESGVDAETLQFGLFDAYSPRYNHLHTGPEVAGWFTEAGFGDVQIVPLPAGSVRVRGIKRG